MTISKHKSASTLFSIRLGYGVSLLYTLATGAEKKWREAHTREI
jgi:uncharacterized membrane protein YeiB